MKNLKLSLGLSAVAMTAFVAASHAAVTYSNATGTVFSSGATIINALPQTGTPTDVNQQQAELIQTFVPTSTFQLSQFSILSGGKGGGAVTIHLYPVNTVVTGQGGGNGDGFVNTQFSTDLLGAGLGLTANVSGSSVEQIVNFAFSGVDQVTLTQGVEYGFEVDSTAGNFSWERDAGGVYLAGNIYQAGSGTTKSQVGGTPDRDGYFAVYSVPEPASLSVVSLGSLLMLRRKRA